MCCCAAPNVNGEPGYSWDGKHIGTHPVNPPDLQERDALLFDMPGRCGGMDSHSHHYRVVRGSGGVCLLARHGGGGVRIRLSLPRGLAWLDLTERQRGDRYWILNALYHAYADGLYKGRTEESDRWRACMRDPRDVW